MPKYHLSDDGVARPCKAEISCPLGPDTPHGDLHSAAEVKAWAEGELANKYGVLVTRSKKPVLTPREIRSQIAAAEKAKRVWQGGDTELAAERTRANVAEQDAKIADLTAQMPEGQPVTRIQLLRKVLFNEGGQANADELVEYLDSREDSYMSDQEAKQRRQVHARLATAHGFAPTPGEPRGWYKVTNLGHGYTMEETSPDRSWGGTLSIRDADGKEIVAHGSTSQYASDEDALRLVGEHLRVNPDAIPS